MQYSALAKQCKSLDASQVWQEELALQIINGNIFNISAKVTVQFSFSFSIVSTLQYLQQVTMEAKQKPEETNVRGPQPRQYASMALISLKYLYTVLWNLFLCRYSQQRITSPKNQKIDNNSCGLAQDSIGLIVIAPILIELLRLNQTK